VFQLTIKGVERMWFQATRADRQSIHLRAGELPGLEHASRSKVTTTIQMPSSQCNKLLGCLVAHDQKHNSIARGLMSAHQYRSGDFRGERAEQKAAAAFIAQRPKRTSTQAIVTQVAPLKAFFFYTAGLSAGITSGPSHAAVHRGNGVAQTGRTEAAIPTLWVEPAARSDQSWIPRSNRIRRVTGVR
jgi:hypothetical protein